MKKKLRLFLLFALLTSLVIFAILEYQKQKQSEKVFTGTIEVTKADIMPKTSGYLETLSVKEGDFVHKGQLAAKLDRKDLKAELMRDTAAYKKAQAQLLELENGARPQELRDAAAKTYSAQTSYDKALRDFERASSLYNNNAVSRQYLDDAAANKDTSLALLQSAKEQESLLHSGTRIEQVLAAKEELNRTKAVLAISNSLVSDLNVYAPLDGVILTKNYEQGEYVNAGTPIATIADLSDCWVKVYIPSTELGKIKIGTKASLSIDSLPNRTFTGYVREISDNAEYTPRQSITKNERANMVFGVKVYMDNVEKIMKPGMPMDVIFDE
ncbi:MAG: HlyD family efflux transporter periplasmic adaptor subunit [Acholeplasmataceae bacterium]|nr:HlyD family efflux transporter periplasmic adaptor subunit [Acholeplasmataceae bacterium]